MRNLTVCNLTALALILGCHAAHAGSVTDSVTVNKQSPLQVITVGIPVDCTWPAGTVVMTLGTTGGDGKAVSYTLGGTPSGDFAISNNTVVVGANGIAAANCNTVENIKVNATQP